ncbi:unnamed protein product, partial [Adineta ricciae]
MNGLIKSVHELINQDCFKKLFIESHKNFCLIYSYVFGIIIPLQERSRQPDELKHFRFYFNNLSNVYHVFKSTELLLHRHLQLFPLIYDSFKQLSGEYG